MANLAAKKLKKYNQTTTNRAKKKSSAVRERLISEYAPLVKTIAGRLGMRLPPHISQDDLIGAGIMGLLDAVDKFNEDKGVEFKSYAEFRIRGAMLDELRAMDWVPRSVRRNAKRLQEAYAKVEKEKMRPADDEEVATEMGIDMESFYQMLDEVRGISIINEEEISNILPNGEAGHPWPVTQASVGLDPLESLNLTEVQEVIAQAIERLPKNESLVVSLYYYEELTMKEIGGIMGYTESRVSQLHTKAVLRLRNSLKPYFDA